MIACPLAGGGGAVSEISFISTLTLIEFRSNPVEIVSVGIEDVVSLGPFRRQDLFPPEWRFGLHHCGEVSERSFACRRDASNVALMANEAFAH
jgi:hypothetical protein